MGSMHQGHRLGRGGCLVKQGCVRHLHAGQVRHHRLKIEQRLQTTLSDLGLVWRVWRVPAGILEDHALDHGRRNRVVIPQPDIRAKGPILSGDVRQTLQILVFRLGRRQVQRVRQTN